MLTCCHDPHILVSHSRNDPSRKCPGVRFTLSDAGFEECCLLEEKCHGSLGSEWEREGGWCWKWRGWTSSWFLVPINYHVGPWSCFNQFLTFFKMPVIKGNLRCVWQAMGSPRAPRWHLKSTVLHSAAYWLSWLASLREILNFQERIFRKACEDASY